MKKSIRKTERRTRGRDTAQKFIQTFGDPLTLDLNNDGIHTVPLKAPPLLFDINASGIKISTGWIAPDDGLLVLDRNGNGMVDNGSELFGDATPKYVAGTTNPSTGSGRTVDGFAALAQEDTNADGVVNAQDANFASLPTAAGATLAGALASYSAAGTREEQLAQIDTLIGAWGATAEFGTLQSRAAAHGYTFTLGLDTASAIAGTGNTLDNVIVGNSGHNILDGGVGARVEAANEVVWRIAA